MPIYEKSTRALMRDMIRELGLEKGQIIQRHQVQNWFQKRYPKIKDGTISAHLIRLSTNARSRTHYSAKPEEDDLFFQIDSNHFRLYDLATDPSPIYEQQKADALLTSDELQEPELVEPIREFAYERDLQNFLAKNLALIEPGLRLYEDEGINGLEFPVGGRFIDILAVDASNNYVVIELKVSKGYDRVIGQLLRYMAWIKLHHAEPIQEVRGIIIAREISEDLLLACSSIKDIELLEYQMAVSLRKVKK